MALQGFSPLQGQEAAMANAAFWMSRRVRASIAAGIASRGLDRSTFENRVSLVYGSVPCKPRCEPTQVYGIRDWPDHTWYPVASVRITDNGIPRGVSSDYNAT